MKGLSNEISIALNTIIDGLNYDFFKTSEKEDGVPTVLLDSDKMRKICESKVSSFNSAKKILDKWISSPNSPNTQTIKKYINKVTQSGEKAITILRTALAQDINFDELEPHKHDAAIKAKPIILESIFDLDTSIRELNDKLESETITLGDDFYKIGYPERFAKGEFYGLKNYFKEPYDEETDSILICPHGTRGETVVIGELNIVLPKQPAKSEILFSDLPKKEQYWRREEPPISLNASTADMYDKYIREEFRRRREGVWFMNNGEAVYLTGHHYFALQWCKMLDNGGYMNFRHAQKEMFYHIQACIVDSRCLGQLFVKSRRTGFTYIILSIFLNDSTGTRNNNFGMTSKSDNDAKKAFFKYRYMLINLPFFFQPVIRGKLDSTRDFEFAAPLDNSREAKLNRSNKTNDYLNNYIDYQPTKNDSYDGQAMFMYLGDECFSPDTKILMSDMSFKEIKDINIGDYVINRLGKKTEVIKKFEGEAELFKVIQPYGKDYVVNGNHNLLFEQGNSIKRTKDIILKPKEYLDLTTYKKRITRRKVFQGLEFKDKDLKLDSYVLGVWLADGHSKEPKFTINHKKDKEILDYLIQYFKKENFDFYMVEDSENYQKWYLSDKNSLKSNASTGVRHKFKKYLIDLGIWGNKKIPDIYKYSSRKQRLELLAGILESDGTIRNNNFTLCLSNEKLIEDIYHLSKSLGLDTSEIQKRKTNFNTICYTLHITDYEGVIPCKTNRKKIDKIKTIKRRTKIEDIIPLGIGEYVGIQLKAETDQERTLVLQDYTLSMNCSKWRSPNDYIEHFGQITPTMLEGGVVVGKAFIGSTVGAMKKGGEQFKELYKASDINKRNKITNMTASGLYRYFLPAQDNMTAFTDIYGFCYQKKPKTAVYNTNDKLIKTGSLEYLISQEDAKKKEGDKALNEQYRAFPRTIEHAFRDESTQCVFNITKLYQQLEHNEKIPEEARYTVGNFEWKNEKDGDVVFYPNPRGRFKVAWMPSVVDGTQQFANNVKEINEKYYPLNDNLVKFGCDPFTLKSTHGEGSKGSIHALTMINPDGNTPSNKFVLEYIARPQDEIIFFEDVIKCIRYYGSQILVESNRIDLLRHMRNRGYRAFAMDRLDRHASKLNINEKEYGGQMMAGKDIIDSHTNAIGSYIEKYIGESSNEEYRVLGEMGDMPFEETLKDWLLFDPDDRTKYDATISSGLAIMACNKEKYKGKVIQKDYSKILNIFTKYDNKGNMGTPISRKLT